MKKTQFSLLITLLISIFIGFGQNVEDHVYESADYLSSKTVAINNGDSKYAGSPYSNVDFQLGRVFKNGKMVAQNVGLRYNVKTESIELKSNINSSKIVANIVKPITEIYVKIMSQVYVFFPSQFEDIRDGYFLVLHEGEKMNFYKKEQKEFIEGKKSINSITRDVAPSYKDQVEFFVGDKSGNLTLLSNSRKSRLNVFPDSKKELKQYINDKKLNISKEQDFLRLAAYYNAL